jgi:hypothetical protein
MDPLVLEEYENNALSESLELDHNDAKYQSDKEGPQDAITAPMGGPLPTIENYSTNTPSGINIKVKNKFFLRLPSGEEPTRTWMGRLANVLDRNLDKITDLNQVESELKIIQNQSQVHTLASILEKIIRTVIGRDKDPSVKEAKLKLSWWNNLSDRNLTLESGIIDMNSPEYEEYEAISQNIRDEIEKAKKEVEAALRSEKAQQTNFSDLPSVPLKSVTQWTTFLTRVQELAVSRHITDIFGLVEHLVKVAITTGNAYFMVAEMDRQLKLKRRNSGTNPFIQVTLEELGKIPGFSDATHSVMPHEETEAEKKAWDRHNRSSHQWLQDSFFDTRQVMHHFEESIKKTMWYHESTGKDKLFGVLEARANLQVALRVLGPDQTQKLWQDLKDSNVTFETLPFKLAEIQQIIVNLGAASDANHSKNREANKRNNVTRNNDSGD